MFRDGLLKINRKYTCLLAALFRYGGPASGLRDAPPVVEPGRKSARSRPEAAYVLPDSALLPPPMGMPAVAGRRPLA